MLVYQRVSQGPDSFASRLGRDQRVPRPSSEAAGGIGCADEAAALCAPTGDPTTRSPVSIETGTGDAGLKPFGLVIF